MDDLNFQKSVIMMGATGLVGGYALQVLIPHTQVRKITTLGRRPVEGISDPKAQQHSINIFEPNSYAELLAGHDTAICTLGVGQPSKVSKDDFHKIDKLAVIDFGKACKAAGIKHFELLSSVGISSKSSTYYLRMKGELVEELEALGFERLSIFQPSMILTEKNRYGFGQGVLLFIWPVLSPLLMGSLRQYRGIKAKLLGKAIAMNIFKPKTGVEKLTWQDFQNF